MTELMQKSSEKLWQFEQSDEVLVSELLALCHEFDASQLEVKREIKGKIDK